MKCCCFGFEGASQMAGSRGFGLFTVAAESGEPQFVLQHRASVAFNERSLKVSKQIANFPRKLTDFNKCSNLVRDQEVGQTTPLVLSLSGCSLRS